MTIIRIRWKRQGGHIHCRVFTAPEVNQTFAKNGDLVFDEHEWTDVSIRFTQAGIDLIQEDN